MKIIGRTIGGISKVKDFKRLKDTGCLILSMRICLVLLGRVNI